MMNFEPYLIGVNQKRGIMIEEMIILATLLEADGVLLLPQNGHIWRYGKELTKHLKGRKSFGS